MRKPLLVAFAVAALFIVRAEACRTGFQSTAFGAAPRGGDGTLPLRLPRAAPIVLAGAAASLANSGARLEAELKLTSASAAPLPTESSLACHLTSGDVSRHAAQGDVRLGTQVFAVTGLCFDHTNRTLEIVATTSNPTQAMSMVAPVTSEVLAELSGRMAILQNQQAAAHYSFQIRQATRTANPEE